MTNKKLISKEFLESIEDSEYPHTVKKCPNSDLYFVYWIDGQIEHRDTYGIWDNNKVVLYCTEKRYEYYSKWIKET